MDKQKQAAKFIPRTFVLKDNSDNHLQTLLLNMNRYANVIHDQTNRESLMSIFHCSGVVQYRKIYKPVTRLHVSPFSKYNDLPSSFWPFHVISSRVFPSSLLIVLQLLLQSKHNFVCFTSLCKSHLLKSKKQFQSIAYTTEHRITGSGNNQGQLVSNSLSPLKDHDLFYDS